MKRNRAVITLTLHPAIDRVVCVGKLQPGATFSGKEIIAVPAGKGVNTARGLRALSPDSLIAAAVWLGSGEQLFFEEWLLRHSRIDARVCPRDARTRFAHTFLESSGRETHIKESMPPPSANAERALVKFWNAALRKNAIVAICGSAPPGLTAGTARALVRATQHARGKLVVDSNGMLLAAAAAVAVDVLKGNEAEIGELLKLPPSIAIEDKKYLARIRSLLKSKQGPRRLLITRGRKGAVLFSTAGIWRATPPPLSGLLKPIATTGCGDAATAGILWALLEDCDDPELLSRAVACGTAKLATADPGKLDARLVARVLKKMCSR